MLTASQAQWVNQRRGLSGHLWANRYYSTALDGEHLWAAVRYVEINPVRAAMVSRAEGYCWSSAAVHCGRGEDRNSGHGGLLAAERPFPGEVGTEGCPRVTGAASRRGHPGTAAPQHGNWPPLGRRGLRDPAGAGTRPDSQATEGGPQAEGGSGPGPHHRPLRESLKGPSPSSCVPEFLAGSDCPRSRSLGSCFRLLRGWPHHAAAYTPPCSVEREPGFRDNSVRKKLRSSPGGIENSRLRNPSGFLWLRSEELAIARVAERVRTGGNHIPDDVVRRRYHAGIRNFFSLYAPIAHQWWFYDNSDLSGPVAVAEQSFAQPVNIALPTLWNQLTARYAKRDND